MLAYFSTGLAPPCAHELATAYSPVRMSPVSTFPASMVALCVQGSFRIAYLQYISDPITYFEPQSFTREPEWMRKPRRPEGFLNLFPLTINRYDIGVRSN